MENNNDKNTEQIRPEEKSKLLIDHEYDGIQELNNDLPPWLMWLFYGTIFFAAIYWVHFQTFKQGALQDEEYSTEVETAKTLFGNQADSVVAFTLMTDETNLIAGAEIYVNKNCAACHGEKGEGNAVGTNLTDEYWINGGTPQQVYDIISNGKLAAGMTAFKDQLTGQQISQIASYVLVKLKGTNPPNAKEPQGEKVAP